MVVNQLLLRRAAVLSSATPLRAFSTTARACNTDPHLKREGPAASKHDKNKFDNGSDDTHYPGVKEKEKAFKDPFPNRPTADRQTPEPESPKGHEGAFADHRGGGQHAEGERLSGSEEAAGVRTPSRVGQMAKSAAKAVFGSGSSKSFSTSSHVYVKAPTQTDRTTPAATAKGSLSEHPGYTTGDAPIDSRRPAEMPNPRSESIPSSSVQNASTRPTTPHPEAHAMADGVNQPGGGADAIHPEDRSQNTWGSNSRSAQFNPEEGKRQPLQHGGSNEGGFQDQPGGKSRT